MVGHTSQKANAHNIMFGSNGNYQQGNVTCVKWLSLL